MRQRRCTLRDRDVQEPAVSLLQRGLRLQDHSRTTTVAVILHVLFYAAATLNSVFAACQRLVGAPTDDTLRKALQAMLPA